MIARLLISENPVIKKREIDQILASFLEEGSSTIDHPDVLYFPADSKLGIEQAKKIKKHFSLKPYSAAGRVAVLEDASALTIDAQNALLKTLEEPPTEAILILAASSDSTFLPTILSRCIVIRLTNDIGNVAKQSSKVISNPYFEDIQKLLESSIEQRFEYIEKLKMKKEFLSALVAYFRQQLFASHEGSRLKDSALQKFVEKLLQAEEWTAQNVNIRAILEYLMLVMPKIERV